jgi:hypothetical protein
VSLCNLQLLDTNAVGVRREKMYKLDDHISCAVAGITGEMRLCSGTSEHGALQPRVKTLIWALDHRSANHSACAADANILINICRLAAQRYYYAYQEPIPVEQLVQSVCDTKQVSRAAPLPPASWQACAVSFSIVRAFHEGPGARASLHVLFAGLYTVWRATSIWRLNPVCWMVRTYTVLLANVWKHRLCA